MLLALWPALIAMPETANYAMLDQIKRDKKRLDEKKSQIALELEKWRAGNGSENAPPDSGLDQGTDARERHILPGSVGTELLGSSGIFQHGGSGGSASVLLADVGHDTVISLETLATIERIKRNNALALILIMANV